jgi:hypothetical protein
VDFVKRLTSEVASCDVLLAVIGPRWLDLCDEDGKLRIDNPTDFVRVEISAALQRDIPVIPILVNGARIPRAERLPADLKDLAFRNGLEVRHTSFHDDVNRLARKLRNPAETSKTSAHAPTQPVETSRGQYKILTRRRLIILTALIVFLPFYLWTNFSIDPKNTARSGLGFDCGNSRLNYAQRTICGNDELARSTKSAEAMYGSVLGAELDQQKRKQWIKAHDVWLNMRDQCSGQTAAQCIKTQIDVLILKLTNE